MTALKNDIPMNRIGIDKLVAFNINVMHIDFNILLTHKWSKVQFSYNGKSYYMESPNGTRISYLKIKDNNVFNEFIVTIDDIGREHQTLSLSAGNLHKANIQNVTVIEIKSYLTDVRKYLLSQYGLTVNMSHLQIKLLEINCTFAITKKFREYHRVIKLLMYLAPFLNSKLQSFINANKQNYSLDMETLLKKNKSMEIIIYNKSKQICDTKDVEMHADLMRIEIRLLTAKKITEAFGDNHFHTFTDEAIAEYYMHQFTKKFINTYRKWYIDNQSKIAKLICKCKQQTPIHWQANFLDYCKNYEENYELPLLLDIEHLYTILKAHTDHNRNTSRTIKSFRKKIENRDADCFGKNDAEKVDEIFFKVKQAYEKTLMDAISDA